MVIAKMLLTFIPTMGARTRRYTGVERTSTSIAKLNSEFIRAMPKDDNFTWVAYRRCPYISFY